ncbi:MAG: DNA polymerase III subunit delta [Bacteroidetes bacterium]|nr:MAG: DNA polymerase III subunit delta [Bacteroidota bacterium]
MTHQQIIADVKKGIFAPVYFLHGPESYFIDSIADTIEKHALQEHERAFNQTILYGKDTDYLQVVDAARRFPMMAERQLVLLREAQEMGSLQKLDTYIENPSPTTVLVICHKHKSLRGNTKFSKLIKAKALVFEAKKLYDNQLPDWIATYLKAHKLKVSREGAELLAEYLGSDLSKVVNELNKLALNLAPGSEVSPQHIEAHIGISKDYNVFEFQRALGQRNILQANRIVNYFIANSRKHALPMIIGSLYNYFSKIYIYHEASKGSEQDILRALKLGSKFFLREYRVAARQFSYRKTEQVIAILREFDLKSKGLGYNATAKPEGELLKEMTWRILHV